MRLGLKLSQSGSGICGPHHNTQLPLLILLMILGKAIYSYFHIE